MWLLKLLFGQRTNSDVVSRLAAKVAQDSHKSVWSRTSHRVLAMRLNEARGYVRARAAACVDAEVANVLRRHPELSQEARAELISRATDHVVGLVIRDVLVMPAAKVARRKAA